MSVPPAVRYGVAAYGLSERHRPSGGRVEATGAHNAGDSSGRMSIVTSFEPAALASTLRLPPVGAILSAAFRVYLVAETRGRSNTSTPWERSRSERTIILISSCAGTRLRSACPRTR